MSTIDSDSGRVGEQMDAGTTSNAIMQQHVQLFNVLMVIVVWWPTFIMGIGITITWSQYILLNDGQFVYRRCHAAKWHLSLNLVRTQSLDFRLLLQENDPGKSTLAMAHESNDAAAICSQFEEACTDFQVRNKAHELMAPTDPFHYRSLLLVQLPSMSCPLLGRSQRSCRSLNTF